MAYQVLARKYRPLSFSDVVGQDHVTRTLLNALSQGRIAHGYIFSGHRGIGKTTIARILASALNCRTEVGTPQRPTPEPCNACESCLEIRQSASVDVIEIDAATNRGIDEVRELRDAARYRPARDKFKIIILDEAHQITDAAFNALLKTLEEPPDHIVFMFATTEPENIPQTIRSRCQHFSFHAVKIEDIVGQLTKISIDENILIDGATLALLAEAGDGSMRDALSIMDQAIASAPVVDGKPHLELEQVRELMGSVSNVIYEQTLEAVHANNSADVLGIIARLLDAGNGPTQIARQFVRFLRNCVVAKITTLDPNAEATGIAADLLQISPEERSRAARSAALFTEEDLSRFLAIMLRTFDELGYRQEQRFHLELGLLKLVHVQRLVPVEEILTQLGVTKAPATTTNTTPTRAAATAAPARPATPSPAPRPAAPAAPSASIGNAFGTPAKSPFEADASRKTPQASAAPSPITIARPEPTPISSPMTNGALAMAPTPQPSAPPVTAEAERPQLVPQATVPEFVPNFDPLAAVAAPPVPVSFTPEPVAATPARVEAPSPAVIASVAAVATPEPPAVEPEDDEPVRNTGGFDLDAIQSAMVGKLADMPGQDSASQAIEDAAFSVKDDSLEVQTTFSKAMLPHLINTEATRTLTNILREHAPTLKLNLLPGTPASKSAKKTTRAAKAGSAAELAEKHPLVQEAKRLFSAEVSNIIDLRK
ncbi:DNA polymerase III subunit gamma/tau [Granulicella cerasi]|uniref:DNA polymerase III subunit gamma/tau n=1 Tax=Granulicella cerasi TaxID=741063 RepID=A0ABW1ZEG2_9BACT|nr:DNA polymerase III subunit gamma/tau [Granulicella cerasi]